LFSLQWGSSDRIHSKKQQATRTHTAKHSKASF